jgi:hypothetical protein
MKTISCTMRRMASMLALVDDRRGSAPLAQRSPDAGTSKGPESKKNTTERGTKRRVELFRVMAKFTIRTSCT